MAAIPSIVSNTFIEYDVWPVSPFACPSLYAFCQGLPPQYRANKNALRAFHYAYDFPGFIYNARQNEGFGDFFDSAMRSRPVISTALDFTRHSVTADMGYIDTAVLYRLLQDAKDGRLMPDKTLFHIFSWLSLEIHLNALQTSSLQLHSVK